MPRIRTIKPEFWTDEQIQGWPERSQLVYIALWNVADDDGRLRAHPALLRSQVCPYHPHVDIEAALAPIIEADKLRIYTADGQTYGYLPTFNEHQRINRPTPSRLPAPSVVSSHGRVNADSVIDHGSINDGSQVAPRTTSNPADRAAINADSVRDHGSINEGSHRERKGKEGKGRERKGEEESRGRARPLPPPPVDSVRLSTHELERFALEDASTDPTHPVAVVWGRYRDACEALQLRPPSWRAVAPMIARAVVYWQSCDRNPAAELEQIVDYAVRSDWRADARNQALPPTRIFGSPRYPVDQLQERLAAAAHQWRRSQQEIAESYTVAESGAADVDDDPLLRATEQAIAEGYTGRRMTARRDEILAEIAEVAA